jgi:hypothetical protein
MVKLKKDRENHKLTLAALAERLKAGAKYEDFDKDLDALLHTALTDRDLVTEEAWEHFNKGDSAGLDGK